MEVKMEEAKKDVWNEIISNKEAIK